jgi:hypothetical protein
VVAVVKPSTARPKTVQIGAYTWTITTDEEAWRAMSTEGVNRNSTYAATSITTLTIALHEGMHPQHERQALLHKLLHACFYTAGLTEPQEQHSEEEWVRLAAPLLFDCLLRNRRLTVWLFADSAT